MVGVQLSRLTPEERRKHPLFKVIRPLLLLFCLSQIIIGIGLLALSIAGIIVKATYASIGMGIWAGFVGCIYSACMAGVLYKPIERPRGVILLVLFLAAQLAYFILCIFALSADFAYLYMALNAITGPTVSCISSPLVNPKTLIARMLIDTLEIAFALAACGLNIPVLIYYKRIYGIRKALQLKSNDQKNANTLPPFNHDVSPSTSSQEVDTEASIGPPATTLEEKIEPVTIESIINMTLPAGRDVMKVAKKLARRFMLPLTILSLVFSAGSITVAIIGMALGVKVQLPPNVWNIAVIILVIIGYRRMANGPGCWYIFIILAFAIGGLGNFAIVPIGIVNLTIDWSEIVSIYINTQAPLLCSPGYTTTTMTCSTVMTTTVNTATVSSVSNNFSVLWRVILDTLHFTLNFYIGCLMVIKMALVIFLVRYLLKKKKKAQLKAQQISELEHARY